MAILAVASALSAPPAPARAQPGAGAPPDAADDSDDAPAPSGQAATVSGVTVTAKRAPQPGAVVGDIKPELQLSPADIRSYGVSTVTELLAELAPETRSDRGRGGESPVVLLNGRRISGFNEVQNIPTEAILRVDILPEEVSLKYGYSANQRVVNIVLRRRFRAWTGELQGGGPTEGGQVSGQAEADLFHVRGDDRLNLDLKYQGASNLTEADRNLMGQAASQPFDLTGNVVSPNSGGEIDPALSALVGRPVTVAGVPVGLGARAPGLADFAATAGAPNVTDVTGDRTLLPATQSITANAVLSRPLPYDIRATVNATLGYTTSDALQGLPGLTLQVPPGTSYSPFSQSVDVERYVAGLGPLRQSIDGFTAHLGSTLNRDLGDWRLSLTDAYDHADAWTDTDVGVNPGPLQAQVDSGALDPFGPLAPNLVTAQPQDVARSHSDSANIQVLANGPAFKLPAGALYVSAKAGDTESLQNSSSMREGVSQAVSLSRNDVNAQLNVDVPLTSREHRVFGVIGDLSLNGNAAVDELSDFGVLKTFGYGLNWTPIDGVNLIVSQTQDQAAPTIAQLGGPVVTTPGVLLFDYISGQTVNVTQISGGQTGLTADHRRVSKVGLTWKPIPDQELTVTANYIVSHIANPIETFPAADAQVEAAFPDRFVRDADGTLVEEDDRPVNFESADRSEIRYGFNYSRPIGPQPPPRAFHRPHGDGDRGGGGDHGGGPPRGFGGGGGRGGRGFGGGRLQFAVYHTVLFQDRMQIRPGVPALDFLNGAAAGSTGGAPRQEIEAQAGMTLFGVGARLSADWKSGTTVRGATALSNDDLSFSSIGTINFRLFDFLGQQPWAVKRYPWLRGTRVSLNVVNLFDSRIQVHDATGATPIIYQSAYLNPAGRTVTLSVRKLFF